MDPNNPYSQPPVQLQPPAGPPPVPLGYSPQPQAYPQPATQQPYPGQPQPQPQTQPGNVTQFPVDYLNQIATPQPVKKLHPIVVFGAIGGVILLAVATLFMLIQSAAPPSANTQLQALQARLETLDKVAAEQGKHLTQSALSSMNSTAGAMLKSMNADVTSYLKDRGVTAKDKSTTTAKNTEKTYYEKLSTKLNDAYLMGTLDRVYASEMTYQLSMLKSKMLGVKSSAKSKKYNEIYDSNIKSLDTISEQLSSFQNTK